MSKRASACTDVSSVMRRGENRSSLLRKKELDRAAIHQAETSFGRCYNGTSCPPTFLEVVAISRSFGKLRHKVCASRFQARGLTAEAVRPKSDMKTGLAESR